MGSVTDLRPIFGSRERLHILKLMSSPVSLCVSAAVWAIGLSRVAAHAPCPAGLGQLRDASLARMKTSYGFAATTKVALATKEASWRGGSTPAVRTIN